MLNIPFGLNKKLENCSNVLLVGMSNSIMESLTIYYTLLKQGKKVHLSNLTNTDFKTIDIHADPIILSENLFGATSIIKLPTENYIEGYLSLFFKAVLNEEKTIWMLNKSSVGELKIALEKIIDHIKPDFIIFVDSGLNSIMIGDEGSSFLTPKFVDTSLFLTAIQQIESIQDKTFVVSCNTNDKDQKLTNKNISNLSSQNGFYGGSYIVDYMNSYKFMKTAYSYLKSNNNIIPEVEKFIKMTDSDLEIDEMNGLVQMLFLNPIALAYNNIVINKVLESGSYYDVIQNVAPYISKRI